MCVKEFFKLKGIIFDFNGTMYFDAKENESAWRRFIFEKIGRQISDEEFKTRIHGRPNSSALTYFLEKELSIEEAAALSEQKEIIYRAMCQQNSDRFHLVEGLPKLLNDLTARNIPIAIATAAGKSNLDFYMKHFKLDRWFDSSRIIYDDGTFPGKPNPAIYLKAAAALSLDPKDCLVVEDSLSGIESAQRAKIGKIIGISPQNDNSHLQTIPRLQKIINDFTEFDLSLLR
jgi:haloacid dehalogenase superfamily, subfamily IA, variant 3 with third motif having DD or ED